MFRSLPSLVWFVPLVVACGSGSGGSGDDDDDDDLNEPVDLIDLCDRISECASNAQSTYYDQGSCVEGLEFARAQAIDSGCGNAFSDYLQCADSVSTCVDGDLDVDTSCASELVAYSTCIAESPPRPTVETETETDTDTEPTPVPTAASVSCQGSTEVEMVIEAFVQGGSRGVIDVADTVNSPASWYESHTLLPAGESNGVTTFSARISTGLQYSDGQSSLFSCDPDVHYDEPVMGSIMSYVFRAYGPSGLVDCFAVGHDPDGMLSQSHETYGNTIDPQDVSSFNCTTGSWSR